MLSDYRGGPVCRFRRAGGANAKVKVFAGVGHLGLLDFLSQ
jgi:hypothetical protein